MSALLAAFVFGTFWYWGFTSIWAILVIVSLDRENGIALFLELAIYLVFLQWIADVNIARYCLDHPINALLWCLGYLVVGVVWSFVKWYLKVSEKAEELECEKIKFLEEKKRIVKDRGFEIPKELNVNEITKKTKVPDKYADEWSSHVKYKLPKASESKALIAEWITYWPFSMVWAVLHDFIHRMIKRLVNAMQKAYDAITKRALRNIV